MVGKTPTRSTNYDPLFALSSDELKGRSILQNKKDVVLLSADTHAMLLGVPSIIIPS
jgi:hypothetical protein